jgi:titin
VSKDNGASWSIASSTSALGVNAVRPNRGATWLYRVLAYTSFGLGEPSATVTIAVAASAPTAPSWSRVSFGTDGSIDLRYNTPSDNGGSPITGYVIEKSYNQQTWAAVAAPAFGVNALTMPRENPGVRLYVRVAAVSALGTSPYSSVASIQIPFLKATAPQGVAIQDLNTYVRASWSVPADLGGSTYVIYHIDYSRDNGATWSRMTSVSSTSANLTRPTKGSTWLYRISTYTSYGMGDSAAAVSVTAPLTVPSTPSIRTFVFNPDQSMTLTFNGSSDTGGTAITAYRIETSLNGSTWQEQVSLTAVGGPVVIEKQPAGTRVYVRVVAVNSVGSSAPSGSASLLTPYLQASAVQGLTATPGSYVSLKWAAPSSLGGSSSVRYYLIQYSADGSNWNNYSSTSGLALNLPNPPKGSTLNYRVLAVTDFGLGLPSEKVTATSPTTAPSSVTGISVTRLSATQFAINFGKPSDLGGLVEWSYRVELRQGNSYAAVASASGAQTNSVIVAAPPTNTYWYYRVVATNAVGDSPSYTIAIRG